MNEALVHLLLFKYFTLQKDFWYINSTINLKELDKETKKKIAYVIKVTKYGEKILYSLTKEEIKNLEGFYYNQFTDEMIEDNSNYGDEENPVPEELYFSNRIKKLYPQINITKEIIDLLPSFEKLRYLLFGDILMDKDYWNKTNYSHKY